MQLYRSLEELPEKPANAFVTIGNFDGVHLGHQMLFSEVVGKAYRNKGVSIAITFDPHPLQVVRPQFGLKLISTFEQKVELVQMAHIDILIILPFTPELAATPAETFIERLLNHVEVSELVVGYDYAFGKGRQGDIPFLREQGKKRGFAVSVVEAFYVDDMLVSSTKIRELITLGRMREVRKLLGRYYQIRGEVMMGKKRGGAELGFPTANLHIAPEDLCPKHGVYVTQVTYGGKCYGGSGEMGCCGGNCQPPDSLQGSCGTPTQCFPQWAACASADQCCTKFCGGGLCKNAACKQAGAACAGGADCCNGLCANGFNGPVKCAACFAAGYKCTSSAQCCGKLCEDGVCKLAPGPCERINGAYCNNAGECCSKKCVPQGMGQYCVEP